MDARYRVDRCVRRRYLRRDLFLFLGGGLYNVQRKITQLRSVQGLHDRLLYWLGHLVRGVVAFRVAGASSMGDAMSDDYYSPWEGYASGRTQNDWDEQNKRIAAMDEPYQEPSRRHQRRTPLRPVSYYFQEVHRKQLTGDKAIQSTRHYARNIFPRDWKITEVSRGTVDNDSIGDTKFERLGIQAGSNYVTIVRYDGKDQYVVDVNGSAASMTSDQIDAFVEDHLE